MPTKAIAARRLSDRHEVLAAMPINQPVTAAAIARKTGFSVHYVGALLRGARQEGAVEQVGTRAVKQIHDTQMVLHWQRTTRMQPIRPPSLNLLPAAGIDAEDLQWMAYWSERYRERLRRQQRNQQREAPCRSTCNI